MGCRSARSTTGTRSSFNNLMRPQVAQPLHGGPAGDRGQHLHLSLTLASWRGMAGEGRVGSSLAGGMPLPTLPAAMLPLLARFAPHVARRVGAHAQVLIGGTLLAPGRRTVPAARRAMGRDQCRRLGRDHRVRRRAHWSSFAVSRTRLPVLVAACRGWSRWSPRARHRRDRGAAPGRHDRRPGPRSCPRARQSCPCRPRERVTRGVPAAARPPPLGSTHLDPARPHRAGSRRALRPGAGAPPPDAHRVGAAPAPGRPALGAGAGAGRGR